MATRAIDHTHPLVRGASFLIAEAGRAGWHVCDTVRHDGALWAVRALSVRTGRRRLFVGTLPELLARFDTEEG